MKSSLSKETEQEPQEALHGEPASGRVTSTTYHRHRVKGDDRNGNDVQT
jgi:hypothetical protein